MALPLAEELSAKIAEATGIDALTVAPLLGEPPQASMGDYSLPCFRLAPLLKQDPKKLAQQLAERLGELAAVDDATAAGPYVNIRLATGALAGNVMRRVHEAAASGTLFAASDEGSGKTVVIEYSSPNIAKPTGVGLLRTTLIGSSLVHLYQAGGYEVVKLNYPGDWGTQFGYVLTAWLKWGDEKRLADEGVRYLVELYQKANAAADEDPSVADEARAAFKKLEDGDERLVGLGRSFRELSRAEFMRVYDLLNVSFDSFDGEAATRPLIDGAVARVEQSGLLKESDGARVIDLDLGEEVPPAMVRKSDGATTYLARDLAEILRRYETWHFDKCIYVVGRDQELHFRQLFTVLELMGHAWSKQCSHVSFGMIRMGGGKMRTRTGKAVGLEDVLDVAFERVKELVANRAKDSGLEGEAQEKASREVALSAVIYADLSRKRTKDYDFDWDRAFSLDGDSGPYLQYAHARAGGVLRKSGRDVTPDIDYSLLDSQPERDLIKVMARHPNAIARARSENEPYMVAAQALDVASAFNLFYNKCRVLGESRQIEDARLLLVWCAKQVLAEALSILGISALESM